MIQHFVGWLRAEARSGPARGRWARLIGRNWARVSYGYRIEPTWLEINRHEVTLRSSPADLDGFRIVQLSDFHCGRQVPAAYVSEAVALAAAEAPDVAVLTGDFIHKGYRHIEEIAEALGHLRARHGVYAVLGNHDFSVRNALGFRRFRHLHRAVARALGARGIRVRQNEAVHLKRADSEVCLVGVDDLWSGACDLNKAYAGVKASVPTVVLAHNPRTAELLAGHRCDLMLSGHTHGGQIHWPGVGRPTLGKKARRFAAGMYRYRGAHVYVNKGVGFGVRFRYGVRPEVALFTLRSADLS